MPEDDFNALMNYLSGNDVPKETDKTNSQEKLPNIPEEEQQQKELTYEDIRDIDKLLEMYKQKEKVKLPPWVQKTSKGLSIVPQELFIHITDNYHILSVKLGNAKGNVLYLYKNGYYSQWYESDCKAFIKSFLPKKLREPSHWEKVYKELLTEYTNVEEEDLNSNEDIVNFRNGVLKLSTGELLPHSPDYLGTIQIPCDYKQDLSLAEAKTTMKFLNHLTGGNQEDIATILEIIGLVISNVAGSRFKKLLILKGKGNTGKSVLRELVIYLVGLANSHTIDIKQLHSQFGLAGIYGKRLVGSGDLRFERLAEIDRIKELTGRR